MSVYRVLRMALTQVGAIALLAIAMFAVGSSTLVAQGQTARIFATPEEAVKALLEAARADNLDELLAIFGPEAEDLLSSGDAVADRRQREVVLLAFEQSWRLADAEANTKELIIGDEAWPFPIPLVKDEHGWRFDTAAGAEEILDRRIGRNELGVIEFCLTYVQAQYAYASQGHDGKPAGLYAQKIRSEAGKQDGLYWRVGRGEKLSHLGDLAAQATAEGYAVDQNPSSNPIPFRGYYFRILTAQGEAAPGGAKSYIVNGEMTGGFALVAHPTEYADSGIMTFIVNQDGIVYQKDLGEETTEIASQMKEYNPDQTWRRVE